MAAHGGEVTNQIWRGDDADDDMGNKLSATAGAGRLLANWPTLGKQIACHVRQIVPADFLEAIGGVPTTTIRVEVVVSSVQRAYDKVSPLSTKIIGILGNGFQILLHVFTEIVETDALGVRFRTAKQV